jgi:PEP-CTERM motif-containing protein
MRNPIGFKAALIGGSFCAALCALPASGLAQVNTINTINSAYLLPRVINDVPGATGAYINTFTQPPSTGLISLSEANVNSNNGLADIDVWYFSATNGASPYQFQNNGYFDASFNLTLTGGTPGYDLEAGWLFSNPSGNFGGDLQSIVTAAGAVVQFGGPSYYPFSPAAGGFPGAGGSVPNYVNGQTYNMGLNYVYDPITGNNAFEYSVNGQYAASSPGDPYFDLGPGQFVGSPGDFLGGYFQIQAAPLSDPANSGTALFDLSIIAVPEPASISLLAIGSVALLARRAKSLV